MKSGPASRRGLAAQLPRQGGHEPTTDERGLADAVAGAVAGADEVKGLEVDRIEIEIEVHIAPPADRAINRLTRPEAARECGHAPSLTATLTPPPLWSGCPERCSGVCTFVLGDVGCPHPPATARRTPS